MKKVSAKPERLFWIYASALIAAFGLTALLTIGFTYSQKKVVSESYLNSIRNDLLLGDYRNASVVLTNAIETNQFAKIDIFDSEGILVLDLASVIKESRSFFLPISISSPIALGPNTRLGLRAIFRFNALEQLPFLTTLWCLALLILLPVGMKHISNVKNSYVKELHKRNLEHVGRMAKQVAHDLRSPLTALKIIGTHASWPNDMMKGNFAAALNRIGSISDDLLSNKGNSEAILLNGERPYPPINGQVQIPDQVAQNSNTALDEILQNLRTLLSEKAFEYGESSKTIRLDFIEDESVQDKSLSVCAEPTGLLRVISNLINNSFEALAEKGFITVSVSIDSDRVIFEVRDNGSGIEKGHLSRVFDEGFSVSKSTGSGLGLAHAKQFAESANGQVKLFSESGRGTTVRLELPCKINF